MTICHQVLFIYSMLNVDILLCRQVSVGIIVIDVIVFQMSDLISRLSDWSSLSSPLAPLTESQQEIISQVGEETRERPRPPHIRLQEARTEVKREQVILASHWSILLILASHWSILL